MAGANSAGGAGAESRPCTAARAGIGACHPTASLSCLLMPCVTLAPLLGKDMTLEEGGRQAPV